MSGSATKMRYITSLLEQCVLINNSQFRPFTSSAEHNEAQVSEAGRSKLDDTIQETDLGENGAEPGYFSESDKISAQLLSVDLDFSKAIPQDELIAQMTLSRGKSTNRRSAKWEKGHRKRRILRMLHPLASGKSATALRSADKVDHSLQHQLGRPQKTTKSVSPASFLSLPGEVRDAIYNFLFARAHVYVVQRQSCRYKFNLHIAIRSTCQQIYAETKRPFFKNLRATYDVSTFYHAPRCTWEIAMPEHVRKSLESFTVISKILPDGQIVCAKPDIMPSLRWLKFIDIHHHDSIEAFEYAVENCTSNYDVATIRKHRDQILESWPEKPAATGQRLSIKYETEIWGEIRGERAARMNPLKRRCFPTTLITHPKEEQGRTHKAELTTAQFRDRHELDTWQNASDLRIRQGNIIYELLTRIDDMDYQDGLDRIEGSLR